MGLDMFTVRSTPAYQYDWKIRQPDPAWRFEGANAAENSARTTQWRTQVNQIRDSFELAMIAAIDAGSTNVATRNDGWARFQRYADVMSFVDMYIAQEFFINKDAGYASLFFAKDAGAAPLSATDPNGSRVFAVAPWDFDAAMGNVGNRAMNNTTTGIRIGQPGQLGGVGHSAMPSQLFIRLWANPEFRVLVRQRWAEIHPGLVVALSATNPDGVLSNAFLDQLDPAIADEGRRWSGRHTNWRTRSNTLRTWLQNRAGNMGTAFNA
jgi:hypothetical protein